MTAEMKWNAEFFCVGQLSADVLLRPVGQLPAPGSAEAVEDMEIMSGGCAGNTAIFLAKLGGRVSLLAAVGSDAWAWAALDSAKAAGVDVSGVRALPSARTSACLVLVAPSGERTFLYRPGANERLSLDGIDWSCVEKSRCATRWLHVGGAIKLRALDLPELLRKAKAAGCGTSLDTDWDPEGLWMKRLASSLPHVDCLVAGVEEARHLTGLDEPEDMAECLLEKGPETVAVKQGPLGSTVMSRKEPGVVFAPAFKVNAVDTTGAGDAYAAGFIMGLSEGWSLERTASFANACGALATTRLGANAGVESLEQAMALMSSRMGCPAQGGRHDG